jgi:3-oxoacyl-[acyl-carrier-protein] synthase II
MPHWIERRVVVTGLGLVTPLGHEVEAVWRSLVAGDSGIDRITSFDPTGMNARSPER